MAKEMVRYNGIIYTTNGRIITRIDTMTEIAKWLEDFSANNADEISSVEIGRVIAVINA